MASLRIVPIGQSLEAVANAKIHQKASANFNTKLTEAFMVQDLIFKIKEIAITVCL